jgi:hypothetical protein
MQTFLTDTPYQNYGFEYLDRRRLVKQLLETRQIMTALTDTTKGWTNHPATNMWRGKEDMLFDYACSNARELEKRSYAFNNNFNALLESYHYIAERRDTSEGWDITDYGLVVYTHRGRLHEKDPMYYAQWSMWGDFRKYTCCERCDYYWPTHIMERVL